MASWPHLHGAQKCAARPPGPVAFGRENHWKTIGKWWFNGALMGFKFKSLSMMVLICIKHYFDGGLMVIHSD